MDVAKISRGLAFSLRIRSGPMKFEKLQKEGVVIFRVKEKKIDSSLAPELKKELLTAVVHDTPKLIVDMASVSYVDSSGLGALLFGVRQANRYNGNLVILNIQPKVKKLIDIAHLSHALKAYESEKEAIRALRGDGSA